MKIALPDVNVLIALAWPSHVHHGVAHEWFQAKGRKGWATCPFTQCGFVRLSSNPGIIPEATSPQDALALLREMTQVGKHVFWPDDADLASPEMPTDLLVGHRQVTDAYLLGLAVAHNGSLVTLDTGVRSLVRPTSAEAKAIEVISVG